jgi:hypothetical protein
MRPDDDLRMDMSEEPEQSSFPVEWCFTREDMGDAEFEHLLVCLGIDPTKAEEVNVLIDPQSVLRSVK